MQNLELTILFFTIDNDFRNYLYNLLTLINKLLQFLIFITTIRKYFQPMNNAYSPDLRTLFKDVDPSIHEGVYVAVSGRTYETQADSLALRTLGADCVGMSTIPEIIVAQNRAMKTLGVSLVSNVIAEDGTNATNHEEVMRVLNSRATEEKLTRIFRTFFQKLASVK